MSKKLSELPSAGALSAADLFEVTQGMPDAPVSRAATPALMRDFISASPPAGTSKAVYYDPANGSDSASGLYPDAPKATLAAALSAAVAGDTLLTRAGTRTHGALALMPDFMKFGRYGDGEDPIFDQSRPIAANAWTAHTVPGVWYADVTHQQATSNPGSRNANACWFQMWSEWSSKNEECLQPYWDGATIAANAAYIAVNPGLFTCHKQGSSQKDPQADGSSTLYRYYVYPADGENPSAGEITYFYAEQLQIASLQLGCSARDMVWQRTATKDGAGHNTHYAERLDNIRILDVPQHAWVGAAMRISGCFARCSPMVGSHTVNGGGWHLFGAAADSSALIQDTEADGFGISFFTHEPSAGDASNRKITLRKVTSRNAGAAVGYDGSVTLGAEIDRLTSINDSDFLRVPNGTVVRNSSWLSQEGSAEAVALAYYGPTGGTVELDNVSLIFRNTGVKTLARNQQASNEANSSHFCTIIGRNLTNIGGAASGSTYFRQIDYKFYDSLIGSLASAYSATAPWNSLLADNCQVGLWVRTLAELQALAPNVNANCVTPWVAQPYRRTVVEGDLAYINTTRFAKAVNGADLTEFTFNTTGGIVVGDQLKILNFDGAGADHICRVTVVDSGTTIHASPAAPSSFSSFKTVNRAYLARKLLPSGTTGITAVFSDDGTQAYFSEESPLIAQGMSVFFGGIGRRSAIGPRKITTLTTRTATLDRPVLWQTSPNGTYITYAPFGTSSGAPRPAVEVSFGMPLRAAQAGQIGWGAQYSVAYASPIAVASRAGEEGTGTSGYARFTNNTEWYLANGSSGAAGQIKHEAGEVDCGFNPIGVGDVLAVNVAAYVEEYDQRFEGSPEVTRLAILSRGLLTERRMGASL